MKQNQFVLVHGFGHGAWCWYKLKPLLEAAGHRVTVFDLSASGINTKKIQDVRTFYDYSEPLLEILASIPPGEKVTLVGHSLGGLNVALAMEKFPEKISVAVFVAALMPDTTHRPSYVVEQSNERLLREGWLDNKISPYDPSDPNSPVFISIGPKFLALKLYQLSPIQDLEIAKTLVRPGSLFQQDLAEAQKFSEERYGSVARVYIICSEDQSVNKEFQHWMIENYPVQQVMEIKGADHMAMCSKPQELSTCLLEISELYS